jgi:hypothetical protein
MNLSRQFKFTHVTLDEVLIFIKEEIGKGNFPQFSNHSDKELLELAQVAKPLIEAKLDYAGKLAIKQLRNKSKTDKATLAEVTNPSVVASQL